MDGILQTLQYNAHLGDTTITVNIDREGNITVPEGTTLENGVYTLSGEEEQEVATFEVKDGQVGRARSKDKVITATILVIELGAAIFAQLSGEEQKPTWAQGLEDRLAYAESAYRVFGEGRTCHCGQVHTLNDVRKKGVDPQEIVDHLGELTSYLRNENIPGFLQTLLAEEQAEERGNRGYDNVEQAQDHLTRVETLLARDPLVVPAPTPAD